MSNKSCGSTNAQYNTYGDGNISRSISTQRTSSIDQVYEILPQEDNKQEERKESKKINALEAKNSLSLHSPQNSKKWYVLH